MTQVSETADLGVIVKSQFSLYQNMSLNELRNSSDYSNFMREVANMYTNGKRANYIRGKNHLAEILGYSTHTIDSVLKDAKEQGFEVKSQKMDADRIKKLVHDYNTKTNTSVKQLANEYGISTGYLYKILKKQEEAGQIVNYRRKKAEPNSQSLTMEDVGTGLPPTTINIEQYRTGPQYRGLGLRRTGTLRTAGLASLIAVLLIAGSSYLMCKREGKHDGGVWKGQAMEFMAESNKLTYKNLQQIEQIKSLEEQVKHWKNRQATDEQISLQLANIVKEYVNEKEAKMNAEQNALEEGQRIHRIVSHESFRLPSRLARAIIDTKTGIIDEIYILPYQRPRVFTREKELEQLADAVAFVYMPNEIDPNAFENSQVVNQDADLKTVEKTSVHMTNLDRLFLFIQEYLDSYEKGPLPGFVVRRFDDQNKVVLVGNEEDVLNLKSGRINLK